MLCVPPYYKKKEFFIQFGLYIPYKMHNVNKYIIKNINSSQISMLPLYGVLIGFIILDLTNTF